MTTNEATGTKDDSAVSPVIGVILMVAITVILAAVIGTFVLGLGENVDNTPNAGIQVEQSPGEVQIKIIDAGNLEGLQVIGPDGVKSNVVNSETALEAGVRVNILSPAGVRSRAINENITVPNRESGKPVVKYLCADSANCGFGLDKSNPLIASNFKETPPGITNLVDAGDTPYNYDKFTASVACTIDHSGFTFDPGTGQGSPVRVPSNVSIPCHAPTFSQEGSGTGTTFERPSGTTESTPILLKEGEYKFLGVTPDGGTSLVRTVTVEEETVGR